MMTASYPGRLARLACDLAFPARCALCGSIVRREGDKLIPLCRGCEKSLERIEGERCNVCGRPLLSEKGTCYPCRTANRAWEEMYPIFRYEGNAARLILHYKKEKRTSLVPFWAGMIHALRMERWPGFTIVPVPPRPEKLARREWDQVEGIARCLESKGVAVARVLERAGGVQQKKLDRAGRQANARGLYSLMPVADSGTVPGSALILDDICTTGATLDACARALADGGAAHVRAIVLAAV